MIDIFEFGSPVDPWNIRDIYKPEFDKVKVLDLKWREVRL